MEKTRHFSIVIIVILSFLIVAHPPLRPSYATTTTNNNSSNNTTRTIYYYYSTQNTSRNDALGHARFTIYALIASVQNAERNGEEPVSTNAFRAWKCTTFPTCYQHGGDGCAAKRAGQTPKAPPRALNATSGQIYCLLLGINQTLKLVWLAGPMTR